MTDSKAAAAAAKALGNKSLQEQRFDDAIAAYTTAIGHDPQDHVCVCFALPAPPEAPPEAAPPL